jgi:hypothetical protein
LFPEDGRTDRRIVRKTDLMKLMVVFRNFANALKNRPTSLNYRRICLIYVLVRTYVVG